MLQSLVAQDLLWKSEEKALDCMKRKADAGLGVQSGTFQNGHVCSLFRVFGSICLFELLSATNMTLSIFFLALLALLSFDTILMLGI